MREWRIIRAFSQKIVCVLLCAALFIGILETNDAQAAKKAKPDPEADNIMEEYDYYVVKANKPYYVGQQKSSFLKKNAGKYDRTLYFGETYYLGENAKKCKISNKKVAKIEGEYLIPLRQGLVTLTDGKGKETKFAVTTYNDKKNVITAKTVNGWMANRTFADAEVVKDEIKTISDAIELLINRYFCYSNTEPYSQWTDDCNWSWLQSGQSIYDYNIGVCCDIAQLMAYLLVEDFEDMGFIYISGGQGHVFNYYYEDGWYYVFDATRVISDNMNNTRHDTEFYQNYIYKCKDIDEVTEVVFDEHKQGIRKDVNYLVFMVSCQGHEYTPAIYNSSCCHYYAEEIMAGKANFEVKFEDCVYDHMTVLFKNPDVDFEISSVPNSELPITLRLSNTAVYGNTVKAVRKENYRD